MKKKIMSYGLGAIVLLSVFAMAMPVSAQVQMAEELGVNDAMGNSGDYVEVPVTIVNTTNGPIEVFGFNITYDKTVLDLTLARIYFGDLTSTGCLAMHTIGVEEDRIRFICLEYGIPDGSTGSVAVLNFSVIGAPSTTSNMNLTEINMKNSTQGPGTAPAKNGTFRVDAGAPIVINPTANPDTIVADGVQESELNVTVSDDIAIRNVTLDLTPIGGDLVHMNNIGNSTVGDVVWCIFNHTTNVSIGTSAGTYHLQVNATDLLGNYNDTLDITLNVTSPETGSITGKITYSNNETGIEGVIVNLTSGSVISTTTTNETGYYNFTEVIPGSYYVNASKTGFWDNSTDVTLSAGEAKTEDRMMLWLKYDLNNNGNAADRGDLILMIDAYLTSTEDEKYDLNENGSYADRGDLILMIDAYLTS